MRLVFAILLSLISSDVFAGGDNASKVKCESGDYGLTIKRKGSFFGENRIILKKGWSRLSEEYEQDWSPARSTPVERLAIEEQPCATKDFYTFLESENTYVVKTAADYSSCASEGERSTIYVQIKSSGDILKFTDCE